MDLAVFDVVLLRHDPPFDLDYLEHLQPKVLIVNDSASVALQISPCETGRPPVRAIPTVSAY